MAKHGGYTRAWGVASTTAPGASGGAAAVNERVSSLAVQNACIARISGFRRRY